MLNLKNEVSFSKTVLAPVTKLVGVSDLSSDGSVRAGSNPVRGIYGAWWKGIHAALRMQCL